MEKGHESSISKPFAVICPTEATDKVPVLVGDCKHYEILGSRFPTESLSGKISLRQKVSVNLRKTAGFVAFGAFGFPTRNS